MKNILFLYYILVCCLLLSNCNKDETESVTGTWSSTINYIDTVKDNIVITKDSLGQIIIKNNPVYNQITIQNSMELEQNNTKISGTFTYDKYNATLLSTSKIAERNITLEWIGPDNNKYVLDGELNSNFNSITGIYYCNSKNKGIWFASKN